MPTLDDIYGGILKPGPQGGIYEPGPEVVFPAQNTGTIARVTPEGLNVYQRPVVAIDSAGNPIVATPPASQPSSSVTMVAPQPTEFQKQNQKALIRAIPGVREIAAGVAAVQNPPSKPKDTPALFKAPPLTSEQRSAIADASPPSSRPKPDTGFLDFFLKLGTNTGTPPPLPARPAKTEVRLPKGTYDPGGDAIMQALYPRPATSAAVAAIDRASPRRSWADSWLAMRGPSPVMLAGTPQQRGGSAPIMRAAQPVASPAPSAPVMAAAIGYNGTNNVTSSELRPVHSSIFSDNAVLPSAMNTRRWVGDGY